MTRCVYGAQSRHSLSAAAVFLLMVFLSQLLGEGGGVKLPRVLELEYDTR